MAQRVPHGYEQLAETFVPKAVGLGPRGTGAEPGHPRGAPVITVHGGRGTGKTALCEHLHDTYAGRLHVAKWPMPGTQPAGMPPPPDRASPLTSRPLAALACLVYGLNGDVPKFGRIDFPRFTYGLMAATTLYEPLDTDQLEGPALTEVRELEQRQRELEEELAGDERPVWNSLTDWVAALIPLIGVFAPGLGPLEDLLERIVRQSGGRQTGGRQTGGRRTAGRRPDAHDPGRPPATRAPKLDQSALRWWDTELRTVPGTGIRKLLYWVSLILRHQVPAQARHSLEEHLTAAFLADIDAHHHRRHWRLRPLPLILLDDTHTPTGRRLRDLLLTAYANAAGPDNAKGAEVTRPVIVATELDARPRPAAPRHQRPLTVPQFATLAWHSPRSHAPEDWQVWLQAPALSADSIAAALGTPCPRGLPNLVEQLSAGRAGCARPLIDAARESLRTGHRSALLRAEPQDLGPALLALPPAAPGQERTVTAALLRYLVPDHALIDALLPWAVALRPEDAPHLPARDPDQHHRVRDLLKEEHWYRTAWWGVPGHAPVIGDRTLRELLLHHLRTETGTAYWTDLHTAAHDRYDPGTAPRLHHALALGRREEAVAGLHEAFARSDRRGWLAAVQTVCAAPHPPDGYPAPESGADCPACPGPVPDDRHRAVGRLLDLLWGVSTLSSLYTDDPESPDNRLRLLLSGFDVAYEDQDLATADAARRWPVLLARGRRVPELPIARREP
ncbi:hypothetical protein IAG44_37925 [Streptomyces roseirectus]|uniref:Uncharacterized protein n=1 Tax=Streptomyces roseirectus TaxID=2768066 RepID=A0A7H0IPF0_9ACTN|nr:hypothetical protein [Streptomyces roseirectus]QNP74666.1 hypothetical protein IAG44_37925 [Streptomyces roseirectus]